MVKSINKDRLYKLNAIIEDTLNNDYKHFKRKLIQLHEVNYEARFLYFIKKTDSKIFFMVDSEPEWLLSETEVTAA
ncbi:hypothetical protein JZU68_03665, partial [bacterium]|nr:hypothetical protein [bacterium]